MINEMLASDPMLRTVVAIVIIILPIIATVWAAAFRLSGGINKVILAQNDTKNEVTGAKKSIDGIKDDFKNIGYEVRANSKFRHRHEKRLDNQL